MHAFSGKKVLEKGLAKRVVLDLTAPFVGAHHVVYCDNFYSSGPLADAVAKDKIFITGTIRVSVDALCRDGAGLIPRVSVYNAATLLAREQEAEPQKHTARIRRSTYTSSNAL